MCDKILQWSNILHILISLYPNCAILQIQYDRLWMHSVSWHISEILFIYNYAANHSLYTVHCFYFCCIQKSETKWWEILSKYFLSRQLSFLKNRINF